MDKSINMTRIVFLAIVAAIGGILFGYDTAVISGTTEIVKNQFRLTTIAEGWYVGCALIGSILGVDHYHKLIVVGAGNLGQALIQNFYFSKSGFTLDAAFDTDPALMAMRSTALPCIP